MSDNKKSARRTKLLYTPKNGTHQLPAALWDTAAAFGEDYKAFLDTGKTERLAAQEAVRLAEQAGFVPLDTVTALTPGTRVYACNRSKALTLAVIGKQPLAEGVRITAAHIDAPRIDLKPNPLYEDGELALWKTHYYGGIKKYQWVAIPLALYGVVVKTDGTAVSVAIGDKPGDPVFTITDLLPHLADEQMKKTMREGIAGEGLNALCGSRLDDEEGPDRAKLFVMSLLYDAYGFTEADFMSAELSLVPAFSARDVGLDRALIGAYGHDDRVCAFAALRGLLDLSGAPEHTAVCLLADKEEVGSEGVTGMQSAAFELFLESLLAKEAGQTTLQQLFSASFCLSADVSAAFDPNYPDVSDKRNFAHIHYGVGICKYTGRAGKSGSSDASAEVAARVRALFDTADVPYQFGELGKVDKGGGGTVALYLARRDIDVIDAGVPVLSMHSPFEVVSKLDVYSAYRACMAVYEG